MNGFCFVRKLTEPIVNFPIGVGGSDIVDFVSNFAAGNDP